MELGTFQEPGFSGPAWTGNYFYHKFPAMNCRAIIGKSFQDCPETAFGSWSQCIQEIERGLSRNRLKLRRVFGEIRFSAVRRKSGGAPPQSKTRRAFR